MVASCLASAAASAVDIAAVRAWAKVEDTGLARSPVTERLLSRAAEDGTSTKEGVTCLFPVTTVTSPWFVLEAEDDLKEEEEPYPVKRPLAPSLRPPCPPLELRFDVTNLQLAFLGRTFVHDPPPLSVGIVSARNTVVVSPDSS